MSPTDWPCRGGPGMGRCEPFARHRRSAKPSQKSKDCLNSALPGVDVPAGDRPRPLTGRQRPWKVGRALAHGSLWSTGRRGLRPPLSYKRTDAERADQNESWRRSAKAFFAAGACHILAWTFLETYPSAGFYPVGLRRIGQAHTGHCYASDGTWAFDHCGWTLEAELLGVTRSASGRLDPEIRIERLVLGTDLESFCIEHHCQNPSQFAFDPRPRAPRYLTGFDQPDQISVTWPTGGHGEGLSTNEGGSVGQSEMYEIDVPPVSAPTTTWPGWRWRAASRRKGTAERRQGRRRP